MLRSDSSTRICAHAGAISIGIIVYSTSTSSLKHWMDCVRNSRVLAFGTWYQLQRADPTIVFEYSKLRSWNCACVFNFKIICIAVWSVIVMEIILSDSSFLKIHQITWALSFNDSCYCSYVSVHSKKDYLLEFMCVCM